MTTTITEAPHLEIVAYIDRDFQARFADRVKLACTLAGGVNFAQLARAMTDHTGREYSRNQVVNVAGRTDVDANRSRISLEKAQDVVDTFAEHYALCYARKDGSAGRPVDLDWFVAEHPTMLTRHIPGYPNDLVLAA